jgi:hypothetical protein
MVNKEPAGGKTGPGRPQVCDHPVRKKITLDAAVLQKLEEEARTQGRSVPDLIRRAVDTFLDPSTVAFAITPSVAEQLEAISRSAPHGRVSVEQMVQKAIEEFVAGRVQAPEVQAELTALQGTALRLVPSASRTDQFVGDTPSMKKG